MNAVVATAPPPTLPQGILRLVRFDLRRFRWLAALVVGLELARAAFVDWTAHVVPPELGPRFGGTFGTQEVAMLDAAVWLAMVVSTAALVQADLPSDDRAFWRTRPIGSVALAAAKLTTMLLLFVVVPGAINAVRLVAYGAPLEALGAATLQIAVAAGHAILPAWALALATRTLPRFWGTAVTATLGGLLVVGAVLYWTAFAGLGGAITGASVRRFVVDWQRVEQHGWWVVAGVTAVAAALLVAHYRHRRATWSVSATATLLVLPWLLPPAPPEPAPAGLAGVGDRVTVDRIEVPATLDARRRLRTPSTADVRISLAAPALPQGIAASVRLKRVRLTGREEVAASDTTACCLGRGPESMLAPVFSPVDRQWLTAPLAVAAEEWPALRQPSLAIETELELGFIRHRWVGTLPLRPGSAFRAGSQTIEVLAFEPDRRTLLVRYTRFPSLGAEDIGWTLFAGSADRARLSPVWQPWGVGDPASALAARTWGRGRTWVGRFHAVIGDHGAIGASGAAPLLFIVESDPIGTASTRLHQHGILVGPRGPAARRQ